MVIFNVLDLARSILPTADRLKRPLVLDELSSCISSAKEKD